MLLCLYLIKYNSVVNWHKFVRVFVSRKKQFPSQIIYVINLDKKDVVCVTAIFILRRLTVHVVLQGLGQNHEIREYGNNNVPLCLEYLEMILSGT